mgnify:CR=1 FL=1
MLELAVLHVFDEWQVELGHVVLVHVEKNVADHNDALLDLLPDAIELSQELLIMRHLDILTDRLKQLDSRVLNRFVEHLTVLVEDQTISRAVELFVAQTTGLLVVDLVDGVLDGLPVLLGLGSLHVGVAHLVTIDEEFICGQIRHGEFVINIIDFLGYLPDYDACWSSVLLNVQLMFFERTEKILFIYYNYSI